LNSNRGCDSSHYRRHGSMPSNNHSFRLLQRSAFVTGKPTMSLR
jgi:hypothetical protein